MISQWWSWLLALTGCLGFWLVGSGRREGWALNIGVQFMWITYAIVTHQWGFILGSIFYGAVFARNLKKTLDEDRGPEQATGVRERSDTP